jgi:hypothetical protein
MNEQDVLGAFLLVNNPIVLSEEETKDVQKAIKKLQQEMKKVTIQQKKFILYLENMLDDENDIFSVVRVKDVLQKCKEMLGDDKE